MKDVLAITNGNIHRVFDAAATGDAFTKALFKALAEGPKYFSTTNDWLVSKVCLYRGIADVDQEQHHGFRGWSFLHSSPGTSWKAFLPRTQRAALWLHLCPCEIHRDRQASTRPLCPP